MGQNQGFPTCSANLYQPHQKTSKNCQPKSGKDKAQFLLNVVITVIVMTVIKDFGLGGYAI